MEIYVGNLSYATTENELQAEFEKFGAVSRATVVTDRDSGRSRGFGFVTMDQEDEARAAIEGMNSREFGGRVLTVNEARKRPERGGGGGGGRW